MTTPPRYHAARLEATINVQAYAQQTDAPGYTRPFERRNVTITFNEQFDDDAGLDTAIDALAATIREAARRGAGFFV